MRHVLAQCHLVFPFSGICMDCGADPQVRSRPPGRLARVYSHSILRESGTRASRADQRVRPTNYAHTLRASIVALAVLATLAAGCGYHVGGQADLVPKDVKVIAIPEFINATMQYKAASLLTADVVREFHARTHYKIVTDPANADAVLTGNVVNFGVLGGITTDPITQRATSSQIVLTLQFTLTNKHTGKVIYTRSGYEFRERYEISASLPNYFDESVPAMRRVGEDAAKAIVTSILEAF
jgi:hypothetical protein